MIEASITYSSIECITPASYLVVLVERGNRAVDEPGGPVGHRLDGVGLRRGAGELFPDQAEGGDTLAELLALGGIGCAGLERPLHAPDGEGPQLEPPHVEDVERDLVALADLSEHVLHRDLRVLEDERRGRAAADAELVLLAPLGEAGRAALDDQGRELVAVDLEEDDIHVGEAAVRDPHLSAVDHVMLAVRGEAGHGLRPQRVGAASRLAERVGGDLPARGEAG
jgi:hypothetical protein